MQLAVLVLASVLAAGGCEAAGLAPVAELDAVLSSRVLEGRVDYAALKRDSSRLDAWLAAAGKVSETDFKARPRDERLAFLLNVYNATTLRLILDHYPIVSIRKIGPVWDPNKAWKLPAARLFGRAVTLNQVEHEMIRPVFKEPRVHFALVCAAKGCPPLRSEAYAGSRLDAQLEDQARAFLSQRPKNSVDSAARVARLSPIFKWYMQDFGGSQASVLEFIKRWLPVQNDWAVEWSDYDWSLNEAGK